MGGESRRAWVAAVLVLGLSGCFYDSRWGQQKVSQQHAAAHHAPQQLRAQSQGHSDARLSQRTFRLRVYATPSYRKTIVNWQKQLEHTLDCANAVFTPEFGAKFEVAEFVNFEPAANEEKLDGLLAELVAKDDGRDVDWVVGLARAVPQFAVSADDLGLARMFSNHFAMRAMSDAHEFEAIQSAFTELSEAERSKLYRSRKQHKLCSVFLHEVAHTLGVPHERSDSSLMHARYQVKSHGYSDAAAQVVRDALRLREGQPSLFLDSNFAQALSLRLLDTNADWEVAGRDQVLRELADFRSKEAAMAGTGSRSAATYSTRGKTSAAAAPALSVAGLSQDEQQSYDRARAALAAGHGLEARNLAAELLGKRGNLAEVQSLRCDIAMSVGGDWETISEECAGLSMLGKTQ
jgi:hypothetical protein